jgi:hypothetical protein
MTQQHPVTPPPELIYEWAEDRELLRDPLPLPEYIANCAAQWGADIELEACCEWVDSFQNKFIHAHDLRLVRRSKPSSLKAEALQELKTACITYDLRLVNLDTIRRALEQLPDNE